MNRILLVVIFFALKISFSYSQANCSNPVNVHLCPSVYLLNQTNAGMLDDAPASFNFTGEDVVYRISIPNGFNRIYVSFVNLTGTVHFAVQNGLCTNNTIYQNWAWAGNSNKYFYLTSDSVYYFWVDAASTVTYNISFGTDTSSTFLYIPNTQGTLQFDNCASHPFNQTKWYFQLSYNGVYQTDPMTLSPLNISGTMCIETYFKNTTGVEGIKQFSFVFDPSGYSNIICPAMIPGIYNPGKWVLASGGPTVIYNFIDSAGIGKGDFDGNPNTCLDYKFCFDLMPMNNIPQFTNIIVEAISDGFGGGFYGTVYSGCCPVPNPICHGSPPGGAGALHGFFFGVNDPVSTLPITLKGFSAYSENERIILRWTTASEINNALFTIERSRNNIEWAEVGHLQGAGNSTIENNYSLIDDPIQTGKYFYRLKQTDYDGKYSYSKTELVNFKKTSVVIYPNPAKNYFNVDVDDAVSYDYSLYNIVGEKILPPILIQGNHATFDVSALNEGIYFLKIEKAGETIQNVKIFFTSY